MPRNGSEMAAGMADLSIVAIANFVGVIPHNSGVDRCFSSRRLLSWQDRKVQGRSESQTYKDVVVAV